MQELLLSHFDRLESLMRHCSSSPSTPEVTKVESLLEIPTIAEAPTCSTLHPNFTDTVVLHPEFAEQKAGLKQSFDDCYCGQLKDVVQSTDAVAASQLLLDEAKQDQAEPAQLCSVPSFFRLGGQSGDGMEKKNYRIMGNGAATQLFTAFPKTECSVSGDTTQIPAWVLLKPGFGGKSVVDEKPLPPSLADPDWRDQLLPATDTKLQAQIMMKGSMATRMDLELQSPSSERGVNGSGNWATDTLQAGVSSVLLHCCSRENVDGVGQHFIEDYNSQHVIPGEDESHHDSETACSISEIGTEKILSRSPKSTLESLPYPRCALPGVPASSSCCSEQRTTTDHDSPVSPFSTDAAVTVGRGQAVAVDLVWYLAGAAELQAERQVEIQRASN